MVKQLDKQTKLILFGVLSFTILILSFLLDNFSIETKDQTLRLGAIIFSYSIYLLILIPLFIKDQDKKKYIFNLIVTYVIINLFKVIISRARPDFMPLPFSDYLSFAPFTFSFPSTHVALAFFLAYQLRKHKLKWLFWIFAVLIAISRLVLGVHFISDVIAGIILGIFMNIILNKEN